MRYARDYGREYGRGYRQGYARDYERWRFAPGEGRPGWREGLRHEARPRRPVYRGRPRYADELDRAWGYDWQNQGWGSAYPGPFSRGLPGATPYPRFGMAENHLHTIPWHTAVPGTGVGFSLPYGMGHGRWL